MNRILLLLLCLLTPSLGTEEETVQLFFVKDPDVREVLRMYERLSGRKVWVALLVDRWPVKIEAPAGRIERGKAADLIRTALKNSGLELNEDDARNTLVSFSRASLEKAANRSAPVGSLDASGI